jgi:hypothetical protein
MNKYRKYLLAITSTAILGVVATSNIYAGPGRINPLQSTQAQSAQKQAEPFHAQITATITSITPSSNPCVDHEVARGSGIVNIGSGSINVSFEAVDEILSNVRCFGATSGSQTTGYHFFMTANGDKLVANVQTAGGPQPNGTELFSGPFSFSGGTGRFAGAVGGGHISVTFPSPASRTGTAVYDGEITLVAG